MPANQNSARTSELNLAAFGGDLALDIAQRLQVVRDDRREIRHVSLHAESEQSRAQHSASATLHLLGV